MEHIELEEVGAVTVLTLNRPERLNALNASMGMEILDAIRAVEGSTSQNVLVIKGAGRAFCSGDDLKETGVSSLGASESLDRIKLWLSGPGRWPSIAKALLELPKPVIAMMHGPAYGAGFELALACDLRIASDDATLAFPVNERALLWGVAQLPRIVGVARAKEILFVRNAMSAEEALRAGLVTMVVPRGELNSQTMTLAEQLSAGPARTYAGIKKALHQSVDSSLYQAYEYQGYALALNAYSSSAAEEGRRAFMEKRSPSFEGAPSGS